MRHLVMPPPWRLALELVNPVAWFLAPTYPTVYRRMHVWMDESGQLHRRTTGKIPPNWPQLHSWELPDGPIDPAIPPKASASYGVQNFAFLRLPDSGDDCALNGRVKGAVRRSAMQRSCTLDAATQGARMLSAGSQVLAPHSTCVACDQLGGCQRERRSTQRQVRPLSRCWRWLPATVPRHAARASFGQTRGRPQSDWWPIHRRWSTARRTRRSQHSEPRGWLSQPALLLEPARATPRWTIQCHLCRTRPPFGKTTERVGTGWLPGAAVLGRMDAFGLSRSSSQYSDGSSFHQGSVTTTFARPESSCRV